MHVLHQSIMGADVAWPSATAITNNARICKSRVKFKTSIEHEKSVYLHVQRASFFTRFTFYRVLVLRMGDLFFMGVYLLSRQVIGGCP